MRIPVEHYPEKANAYSKKWAFDHSAGVYSVCAKVSKDVIEYLFKSELVIADLSGRNANVYYELGVRHSFTKNGTIPILSKGENLPFDVVNYRVLYYTSELDGPEIFKKELYKKISFFEANKGFKADNPVHDFLGRDINKSVDNNFDEIINEIINYSKSIGHTVTSLSYHTNKLRSSLLKLGVKIEVSIYLMCCPRWLVPFIDLHHQAQIHSLALGRPYKQETHSETFAQTE